jgi:hypothetical protein
LNGIGLSDPELRGLNFSVGRHYEENLRASFEDFRTHSAMRASIRWAIVGRLRDCMLVFLGFVACKQTTLLARPSERAIGLS